MLDALIRIRFNLNACDGSLVDAKSGIDDETSAYGGWGGGNSLTATKNNDFNDFRILYMHTVI